LPTVLIIDDSSTAREQLRAVLDASGRFECILEARDGIEGLRLLLAKPVDAVICDLEMPGLDGEKLLAAQHGRSGGEELPFLFLTAQRDPDRMARLLRNGACDIVRKPFHSDELLARLELHMRLRRLQAELREKNAVLAEISITDLVTGLRNRRYVTEFLSVELLRSARYKFPLGVLLLDLDDFKRVNDTHGHKTGDRVLQKVGETLRASLRGTDLAGRFGGEEFLVVLPQTGLEGSCALAERIRQAIAAGTVEVGSGPPISVTVSIGAAVLAGATQTAEQLLEAADAALYAAKAAGRDRVVAAPVAPRS
jgi:diguanylate cyclase (GGDEF)-like protein